MNAVYRNLNSKRANNGADLWSISNAHIASTGYLVIDKGVTHGVNFSVADPITNAPASIAKGCGRITKNGSREVVAVVGGTVAMDTKPSGQLIGRLTLDLQAGQFMVITDNGRIPFDNQGVVLWFGSEGCSVYK